MPSRGEGPDQAPPRMLTKPLSRHHASAPTSTFDIEIGDLRAGRRAVLAEKDHLALAEVPIGTYFTATIVDRAQLCLRTRAGDILVVSDDPPHLLPPALGDATGTPIMTPSFRPQA